MQNISSVLSQVRMTERDTLAVTGRRNCVYPLPTVFQILILFPCFGIKTGCSRNFVDSVIHCYNNKGLDSVLEIAPLPRRPGRLKGHMDEISRRLESEVPRSPAEAAHIIRDISGISFSLTWTMEIMHHCGFRFIKA